MSNLYIALIYLSFFVVGVTAPFVLTLGYVWGDAFYPQEMSNLVGMLPSSMIVAVAAVVGYLAMDRKSPPRFTLHAAITLLYGFWVTLTLAWAEVPDAALTKWNWAVKTVVFSTFLPVVFRSRVQIEAFLQVFLFAVMLHILPRGLKDFISGSAYGRNLGVINSNSLLLESSTLATFSIALIPIIMYFRAHSVLLAKSRLRNIGGLCLVFVCVLCAISTYARTALIGFIVVGFFMFLQSRRKILFGSCALAMVIGFGTITADSWDKRIETTTNYDQEDSALGRILVWEWTLKYSFTHPFGGGFNSYMIDTIELPGAPGQPPTLIHGKAFHNIYFESLGEQGYPGLLMFVTIQLLSLYYLLSVARRTRHQPHLRWLHDLSRAGLTSLLTILACGCFIGIGFQAQVWYFLALPVCLREYLHRVEKLESAAPQAASPGRKVATALVPAAELMR